MKHKFHRLMLLALVVVLMAVLATAATAATPQGFNAQITVEHPDDSTMVVTIDTYSSDILAAQTPTLLLPCSFAEAYVTFGEETVDSVLEAGEIRFAPAAGGSYTIHAGKDPNAHVHTEVTDTAVAATCTEAGKTEGKHCSVCGEVIVKQKEVPAAGHKEVTDAAVAATCTEAGKTEGKHCSVCGEVLAKQKEVPAAGHKDADGDFACDVCGTALCTEHTPTVIPGKAATCTAAGLTKGSKCSNCGKVITAQKEIPALGHKEVTDAAVAATCTEAGKTEGKHCSVCGEVLVKQKEIPALAHSYTDGKCSVCGAKDPDYVPEPIENPFTDVADTAWYVQPVLWAVQNNVTGGIGNGQFGPDVGCTRGQVVTFLWAAAGRPEPKNPDNPFTDVSESDYFYKAVLWAVENNITGGVGEGLFGPHNTCTRGQIVTFLWASQGKPEVSAVSEFTDVADTDWYAKPVMWAAKNGVTGGIGEGLFGPNNTCTRGQVVTFLYKVYG